MIPTTRLLGSIDKKEALAESVESLMPYLSKIIKSVHQVDSICSYEDLEAETKLIVLEYLIGGGEAIAAKVGMVVRGRLRNIYPRILKYTAGEERLVRVIHGVRAEAERQGNYLEQAAIKAQVIIKCTEWAKSKGAKTEDEIHKKLSQRGILKALKTFSGLYETSYSYSLDAPRGEDGKSLLDYLEASTPDNTKDLSEKSHTGLDLMLGHLSENERAAVEDTCGLGTRSGELKHVIAEAHNITVKKLNKILGTLEQRMNSTHTLWALYSSEVPEKFVKVDEQENLAIVDLAQPRKLITYLFPQNTEIFND